MTDIRLAGPTDFAGWREAARRLAAAGVPPEAVRWRVAEAQPGLFEAQPGLFDGPLPEAAKSVDLRVPLRFLLLAKRVILHRDPGRFALLYRLLWRLGHGERRLLERLTDADVAQAELLARAVQRAAHRMAAFVRFKEVWTRSGPCQLAWFEPEHHVLELCAASFTQRLKTLRWAIVTPERTAYWDGATLVFGPGGPRSLVPAEDAPDAAWRAYHASLFDTARRSVPQAGTEDSPAAA